MSEKDKESSDVIDVESAEERLGPDLIDKIASKEWKTAPLPTEEELSKEKPKSPKSRNNPNSRKNLAQYNKNKKKETKKIIVEGMKFKKKREDVNPFDYIVTPAIGGMPMGFAFSFLLDVPLVIIDKKWKTRGPDYTDKKYLIVDDVVSTYQAVYRVRKLLGEKNCVGVAAFIFRGQKIDKEIPTFFLEQKEIET